MTSDGGVEHRLSAWNPNAEEVAAILIEMRPIVRAFAERDAPSRYIQVRKVKAGS